MRRVNKKDKEMASLRASSITEEEHNVRKFKDRIARFESNDRDTYRRMEIQNEIRKRLIDIYQKIQENPKTDKNVELAILVEYLKSKPEYQRYSPYIETWVENQDNKIQKEIQKEMQKEEKEATI